MKIVITYRHHGDSSYLELIDMAFESAKRHGYQTILVGNISAGDHNICPNIPDDDYLMNWILKAQLAYIESFDFDENSVFFSPDALINKPLDAIFDKDFDLALTERKNRRWPINNGVIFIKPKHKDLLSRFWQCAIKLCEAYPIDIQKWYGDQQSLGDLVALKKADDIGLNLSLLPCEKYNASPRNGEFDTRLLNSAHIIHLKGKRKHLMKTYLEAIYAK